MENRRLGKYEIRGTLGKGAMGTVYDGFDAAIDRRVAIKTMPLPDAADDEGQDGLQRFRREAQAAGRLTHPNIVAVFDYGEDAGLAFIVMEYAPGTELKKILDKGDRLPPAEAVRIMQGVLAGLNYSHERGVVHRDIKPGNVILSPDGTVKIADFGIARIESSNMTQAGTIMGTPAYMSPEQFMGQTVDQRTDIYSAGVMFYQLLTGERPFEGSMSAIMHKALNTEAPRPSDLSVTAPSSLDAVVARSMAKRPEDRFGTASAFAAAITEAMQAGARGGIGMADPLAGDDATMIAGARPATSTMKPSRPAPPPSVAPAASPPPAAKSKLPLLAGVAVAVLALVGAGGYFALSGGKGPAPDTQLAAQPPAVTPPVVVNPVTPPVVTTPPVVSPPVVPPAILAPVPAVRPPVAPPSVTPPPVAPPPVAPPVVSNPVAPPPDVSTPPVAPPVVTPPPVVQPAMNPAAIRDALLATLQNTPCSLTRASLEGGRMVVSGVAGALAMNAVHDAAQTATRDGLATNLNLGGFDGPYCDVLDTIRPIGGALLNVSLRNNATVLRKNDLIVPQIVIPDYPGWLTVDYFPSDGSVTHLHPSALGPAKKEVAGTRVLLGNTSKERWQVDIPFGTDIIVAIVSAAPLFSGLRPDDETAAQYVPALKRALDDAARNNARVSVGVMLLQTKEK